MWYILYKEPEMANKRSFTLIEILVTLIIIGIIAAFGVPSLYNSIKNGAEQSAQNNLITLYGAEKNYYFNQDIYCVDNCADNLTDINSNLSLNVTDKFFNYSCASDVTGFCCTATSISFNPQVVYSVCGQAGGSPTPPCVITPPMCDCSGNVDLGCGCGQPGPSGCDNKCGSTKVNDACGKCGGTPGCTLGSSCTNPTTGCSGTETCGGGSDICKCTGGPTKDACGKCNGTAGPPPCPGGCGCTLDTCQVLDACGQCNGSAGPPPCPGGCTCSGDVCHWQDSCGNCDGDGSECGGTPGSTPYLFVRKGHRYYIEDDVMNTYMHPYYEFAKQAYEKKLYLKDFIPTDRYVLKLAPAVYRNGIKLMLWEIEPEESHISEVQLLRVIHDKDAQIIINNENNEIKAVKTQIEQTIAYCRYKGNDCTEILNKTDGQAIKGVKGDTADLRFDITKLREKEVFIEIRSWLRLLWSPILKPSKAFTDGQSINFTLYDPQNPQFNERYRSLHSRSIAENNFIRITDELKHIKGNQVGIRIQWTGEHFLDSVRLVSVQELPFKSEVLGLTYAKSTRLGNVMKKLKGIDHTYLDTLTGDKIYLIFSPPQLKLEPGQKDDYVFAISGFQHGLRTYLYPKIDAKDHSLEIVNRYIKELDAFLQRNK